MKPKIVVLTGPTAAGKTVLSIKLAKKFDGEIISADSRQVYRGMDVGTDKIKLGKNGEYEGVKHHLIDVASPKRTFTVAQWKKRAEQAITDIVSRGQLPLVVGGSAFYIEALIYNLNLPRVKPKASLRAGFAKLSTEQLMQNLRNLDRQRAERIDPKNRVRIIRSIEIAMALGKVPRTLKRKKYDSLILGIKLPDEKLKQRIRVRVDERVGDIVKEIKKLRTNHVSFRRLLNFGLEYRFYSLYLQGKLTKHEAIEQSKTATWRFAKRQYSFFNRLPIQWIKNQTEAEKQIRDFLL